MIATTVVFAVQDGLLRHLGSSCSIYMVVMIRFWFFVLFVVVLAARAPGGLRAATRSAFPWIQLIRGRLYRKVFIWFEIGLLWTWLRCEPGELLESGEADSWDLSFADHLGAWIAGATQATQAALLQLDRLRDWEDRARSATAISLVGPRQP